jgi:hypothetical protein
MHSLQLHIRLFLATTVIALAAAIGAATAGARADFIPGVTDFSTGVLHEPESADHNGDRYIAGVTDSTTGVLRELEQRRKDGGETSATTAGGSGLDLDQKIVAGAVAATVAAASLAVVAGGRRRRAAI